MKTRVNYASIYTNQTKKRTIDIINNSANKINLSFDKLTIPKHIKAEIPATLLPNAKGVITISYNASLKNDWDYVIDRLYLQINNSSQKHEIYVNARIEEDFSKLSQKELKEAPIVKFEDELYNFGTVKSGKKIAIEFKYKNLGKRDLIIRKLQTNCACISVGYQKITKANSSDIIKIIFDSNKYDGNIYKTIKLVTNIPGRDKHGRSKSKIILRIKGKVERL